MTNQETAIATTANVNWIDESGEVTEQANWKQVEDGPTVFTTARSMAGNMSPAYNQYGYDMDTDEKKAAAAEQLGSALAANGLKQENAFIMLPQQNWSVELGVVNVDDVFKPGKPGDLPTVAADRADLLITKNPEVAIICRPADCPVLTLHAIDNQGKDTIGLLHVGWQGLNAGYLEQGLQAFMNSGVDKDAVRIQMSGAGYAHSFHYQNAENPLDDLSYDKNAEGYNKPKRFTHPEREHLFVNVESTTEKSDLGQDIFSFDMDMPGFIRHKLKTLGISDYQLFEEGSDTTHADSGYSSHRRDGNDKTKNTRDAVVSTLAQPDQELIRKNFEERLREKGAAILKASNPL